MNTRTTHFLGTLVTLIALSGISNGFSQPNEPMKAKDLKAPATLAAALRDEKAAKPVIFNIGSAPQIKSAILIGPVTTAKNLETFKQELAKLPKDKEIVIYCGCCPFQRCPNARPALELVKQMKFTNAKLLKLPTSLSEDWIGQGYPME